MTNNAMNNAQFHRLPSEKTPQMAYNDTNPSTSNKTKTTSATMFAVTILIVFSSGAYPSISGMASAVFLPLSFMSG